MYKLINYTNNNISINVRYDEKNHTIWLTQNEIALVFGTTKSNITMHIKNVVKTSSGSKCDLPPEPIEDFVNNQKTKLYNLSMIEAISERSKSISGSEFIMWANELLSQNTNNQLTNISPSQAINYEIVTFNDGDFSINVSVSPKEETVWLTVSDIASIFERSEKTIYAHIQKIFAENELDRKSNSQKTRIPFSDKLIEVYNFEVLLSVGYKVTSDRGTKFRIWASKVLKQYSIKGYALNPNRIAVSDENYLELKDKVSDMQSLLLKDNKRLDSVEQKINEHDDAINKALGKDDIFKGMILFEGNLLKGESRIFTSSSDNVMRIGNLKDLQVEYNGKVLPQEDPKEAVTRTYTPGETAQVN